VRLHAGEQLVENQPERVDVAGGSQRIATHLLRARVCRRHHAESGARHRLVRGGHGWIEQLGNAEVEELDLPGRRHQNVPWLQVAMQDQVLMCVVHGGAHS
jgi:hypothetical protein